jgi:threonine dehydratase
LGAELWLKREDCTPIGSFKLRGALVTVADRAEGLPDAGVYVATAGNYGLAIAAACQRRGVEVTVFVPPDSTPSKLERLRLLGATVVQRDGDFDAVKQHARDAASRDGAAFWEDGRIEEMALGAGTIATEILDHSSPWDLIAVPLGNGSLLKGIAAAARERSPRTSVVGLVAAGAPSMASAIADGSWEEERPTATYADGLAVRVPIAPIVEEIRQLIDDVWLVEEPRLLQGVRALLELEQTMVEPSAAITIAGLADHRGEIAGKRVVAVLTGSHLRPDLLPAVLQSDPLL